MNEINEDFKWEGVGYYASRQVCSHENTHIETRKIGGVGDDEDEVNDYAYKNGWGTPMLFLGNPE